MGFVYQPILSEGQQKGGGSWKGNSWKGISPVIPAYNEENRISKSLDSHIPVLQRTGMQYEVIVAIDGSDRTYDVAVRYAGSGVRAYRFDSKPGKGGAVRKGIDLSSNRYV